MGIDVVPTESLSVKSPRPAQNGQAEPHGHGQEYPQRQASGRERKACLTTPLGSAFFIRVPPACGDSWLTTD